VNDRQKAMCIELRGRGLAMSAIARELGVTKNAVVGHLDRSGIKGSKRVSCPVNSVWTPELSGRCLDLLDQGANRRSVAAELGVTPKSVEGYLTRNGISLDGSDYSGPTTFDRLKALHDQMNALPGVRRFEFK
jgi:predicted transcriptional regulator